MNLLILGASGRAAAFSALRAGFSPTVIDLFADRDLKAVAPCRRADPAGYPDSLFEAAHAVKADAWLYTGALENRPDLVDGLAARLPLWGTAGPSLRTVRDPFALADVLAHAGYPFPEVRREAVGLPTDGTWLRKPFASGGGAGITDWRGVAGGTGRASYYQRRLSGLGLAAVFGAGPDGTRLLGVSRQWVGHEGVSYGYRGSLAPWPLNSCSEAAIERLGTSLADAFSLRGLFGLDLMLVDGAPWLIEVNPRYTASVEVLELALNWNLLTEHDDACRRVVGSPSPPDRAGRFVAKEVLFAPEAGVFRAGPRFDLPAWNGRTVPDVGDVPEDGTPFLTGEPVLTLFAAGETVAECEARLDSKRDAWRRRLGFA